MQALAVFFGGGLGALARWGLSLAIAQPWATVAVNLLGSFLLAFLMHPGDGMALSDNTKLALATGFMGSFTTYSTFNWLMIEGMQKQEWSSVLLQFALTVVGALLCGLAGWQLGEVLKGPAAAAG